MDFTTNYCGMYYSDGKIQSSVSDGLSEPVNELDYECREHDAAYALAGSVFDLDAADNKFYKNTSKLGIRGKLYGNLVKHGNSVARHGPMAMFLPIIEAIGANQILSGMLPENTRGQRLRGTKYSPERLDNTLVTGTSNVYQDPIGTTEATFGLVYDPVDTPSLSSDGYVPAGGLQHNVLEGQYGDNVSQTKRGFMRPITEYLRNFKLKSPYPTEPIRPYKPLKKKKYYPPKNKNKKKNKIFIQA